METDSTSQVQAAYVARRNPGQIRFVAQTGFYPLYDGANDQVDRVSPVATVRFQRVIPRYRLSSSETSDTGLGPTFYATPVYDPGSAASISPRRARQSDHGPAVSLASGPRSAAPLPDGMGTLVDLYA